jgi:[ribosomal protein S5]-alanine N-acetyltransferase
MRHIQPSSSQHIATDYFAIADAESDKRRRRDRIVASEPAGRRRDVGLLGSAAHRGRGIASSALKALTTFAWTIPALHRIDLYIKPWNNNSIHVAEASGCMRDGLLRSHQEIGGTRRAMLLYSTMRP